MKTITIPATVADVLNIKGGNNEIITVKDATKKVKSKLSSYKEMNTIAKKIKKDFGISLMKKDIIDIMSDFIIDQTEGELYNNYSD